MDLLTDLRTFARVAEKGSFSAVAREMGTTQPAASRQVAALEEFYGVRLIHRTTRSLTLTEEGRTLLLHANAVLADLDAAQDALRPQVNSVSGVVRIGTPVALGLVLGTKSRILLERHPMLSIEISISESFGNMVEEGFDILVTIGTLHDTTLVSRRIAFTHRLLVASPAYLNRVGEPQVPQDLLHHECITYPGEGQSSAWEFTGPNGDETIPVHSRLRTNSSQVVCHAVLEGAGIGLLPKISVSAEVESGKLRKLLSAYSPKKYPIYVLYPSRRNLPARTRSVIQFLIEEFEGNDGVMQETGRR